MVLAKLLSPEKVGQFALGLAICAPIITLSNLGLNRAQATDAQHEYNFGTYLALRLINTTLAMLAITAICLLSSYSREVRITVFLIGMAKAFEAISDIYYGFLQQRERMDRVARSMMVKGTLSLVTVGLAVFFTHSIICGVVALAASWGLTLIAYDRRAPEALDRIASRGSIATNRVFHEPVVTDRPRWSPAEIQRLSVRALPLGVVDMFDSLNPNIPRYFIQLFMGQAALGYYSAVGFFMQAGGLIVATAFVQAAAPRLARHYINDFKAFKRLLSVLLLIAASAGAAGAGIALLAGRGLLRTIYRPDYSGYANVLFWIMIAAWIWYLAGILACSLTAARRFNIQVPIFGAMIAANALCCLWFVPKYGLLGAAWALCVGMLIRLLGNALAVAKVFREQNGGLHDATDRPS